LLRVSLLADKKERRTWEREYLNTLQLLLLTTLENDAQMLVHVDAESTEIPIVHVETTLSFSIAKFFYV
jgi:hypothetical protein